MKKFLIVEYQEGGCDYTIGCGVRLNGVIEAPNKEDAIAKFVKEFEEDWREDGVLYDNPWNDDTAPNRLGIYEIVAFLGKDNLDNISHRAQHEVDTAKRVEAEDKEKAELERLKAKYED